MNFFERIGLLPFRLLIGRTTVTGCGSIVVILWFYGSNRLSSKFLTGFDSVV